MFVSDISSARFWLTAAADAQYPAPTQAAPAINLKKRDLGRWPANALILTDAAAALKNAMLSAIMWSAQSPMCAGDRRGHRLPLEPPDYFS